MDGPALARILAIIVIAVAMTAAAVDMARRDRPAPSRPPAPVVLDEPDPHREALARCQTMGEAAIRDAECLAVWAENRRRFLGPSERP